ncbi:GDSL-type esterase/lipase family protein [Metabacillus sp. GX 13764]|uniref:SGNH/GDSL hydrolase family protein n=1 Tax=Metabacillus kandeliae TaxID=2900151 RepID=UPI001E2919F4|nr:GDSL-type esterase/lipase family protein [Metabacillus kandeliae]MCD7034248.1 GDSL-type esterase/lipase family protein [Metabacillus kandeliae]
MKILCIGDSLTRGVTFVKGRLRITKKNYPYYLQDFLQDSDAAVINKGVFNDHSGSLMKRLQKDALEEQPDYAIIEIGGNDCGFSWKEVVENPEGKHEAIVPIDRCLENVESMISALKEGGIVPIVMTLPPLDPVRYYQFLLNQFGSSISHLICSKGGADYWHGMYNRSLAGLAHEMKTDVIDVRAAFLQEENYSKFISDDGIHLTSDGYRIMGRTAANYFKNQDL